MADARRSRYALVAARTRKRNEIVRGGAAPRKTSAKRESERIESGRRTVSEAFGGVPNKTAFLKRAHLFERKKNAKAVDRAYIFPEGEEDARRLAEEKPPRDTKPLAHDLVYASRPSLCVNTSSRRFLVHVSRIPENA